MTDKNNFKFLNVVSKSHLRVIQFNRPSKKNAINGEMYKELIDALNSAAADDSVVITALTGSGEYYSSGHDLSIVMEEIGGDLQKIIKAKSAVLQRFVRTFIDFPKILVGVVNGPAIGIAATTLGLCDVVFASDKATFATPFTSLGFCAEGCSSYTFPRIMGYSKANEMLLFNKQMNAHEAKECHLVSEVFPHEELTTMLWPKLEELSKLPAKSMLYSKALVRNVEREALHKACTDECHQLEERWQSEDCINAAINFLQQKGKL